MIFCFTSWHIHDSILSSFNSGFSCVCKGIAAAQVLIWVGLCGHKLPASSLSIHSNTNSTEEHPLRCLIHNRPQGSHSAHRLDYVCVCCQPVVVCSSKISLQLWLLYYPPPPLDLLPLLHVPCQLLHVVSTCTCCHLFVTKELRTFVSCKVHLRTFYVCRQVWGGGE